MKFYLKPLNEQVMVITGASSGIGLVTAREAARRGASLILVARSSDALNHLVNKIRAEGGSAVAVKADVGAEADVSNIVSVEVREFGGFDTWVNNAGITIYGELTKVVHQDSRCLFETNFWGVVNGSLAAVELLKIRGGALINIGSSLSDQAIPVQGMYCASKHAVKGFTDSLRMELEKGKAPISVTLVKPAAIDTPYIEHGKNYMEDKPNNPPPVYAPEVVADVILY